MQDELKIVYMCFFRAALLDSGVNSTLNFAGFAGLQDFVSVNNIVNVYLESNPCSFKSAIISLRSTWWSISLIPLWGLWYFFEVFEPMYQLTVVGFWCRLSFCFVDGVVFRSTIWKLSELICFFSLATSSLLLAFLKFITLVDLANIHVTVVIKLFPRYTLVWNELELNL